MRLRLCCLAICATIFGQFAFAGTYHVRYITGAVCTSGTFKADKNFSPGGVIGQPDFDGITKAFKATIVEKDKSGAILFRADGLKSQFCSGSDANSAWVTISYDIIE